MKNIIVGILTIVIFGLMLFTYIGGGAYNGGNRGKVIENIAQITAQQKASAASEEMMNKKEDNKEQDKLTALREKAGNSGAFKVSQAYKSKCSSCHGVNGSGEQNGKKLIGPKLFGLTTEQVYKNLSDFKSGRRENLVMRGLLLKLTDDDLKKFAEEIGDFPRRAQELNK
ncbi:c-type cytochrome [Sulfurimonas sp. HSL-1716]|uniref:c-type cytochrome n=1 Tax=Hydrocurvibacter sulfurireducens TaxID=3131937 RepID=UPI0031F92DA8